MLLVGGIGYEIFSTPEFMISLETKKEIQIYTHLIIREDEHTLYGFGDRKSLDLFRLVISVSGVGPKVGLSLLSASPTQMLANALASGDLRILTAASGVGKKLAERIALEVRGKVPPHLLGGEVPRQTVSTVSTDEAEMALITLGFRENQVRLVLGVIAAENPEASTQELIKLGLKALK